MTWDSWNCEEVSGDLDAVVQVAKGAFANGEATDGATTVDTATQYSVPLNNARFLAVDQGGTLYCVYAYTSKLYVKRLTASGAISGCWESVAELEYDPAAFYASPCVAAGAAGEIVLAASLRTDRSDPGTWAIVCYGITRADTLTGITLADRGVSTMVVDPSSALSGRSSATAFASPCVDLGDHGDVHLVYQATLQTTTVGTDAKGVPTTSVSTREAVLYATAPSFALHRAASWQHHLFSQGRNTSLPTVAAGPRKVVAAWRRDDFDGDARSTELAVNADYLADPTGFGTATSAGRAAYRRWDPFAWVSDNGRFYLGVNAGSGESAEDAVIELAGMRSAPLLLADLAPTDLPDPSVNNFFVSGGADGSYACAVWESVLWLDTYGGRGIAATAAADGDSPSWSLSDEDPADVGARSASDFTHASAAGDGISWVAGGTFAYDNAAGALSGSSAEVGYWLIVTADDQGGDYEGRYLIDSYDAAAGTYGLTRKTATSGDLAYFGMPSPAVVNVEVLSAMYFAFFPCAVVHDGTVHVVWLECEKNELAGLYPADFPNKGDNADAVRILYRSGTLA